MFCQTVSLLAPEESLFYKIWYPGSHYLHYEDGALEDFGFGRIHMRFVGGVEPKDLGIDPTEIEKMTPTVYLSAEHLP